VPDGPAVQKVFPAHPRAETQLVQTRSQRFTHEKQFIRALSEDLALEVLASYTADDFHDADSTSLGDAAVYLEKHGSGPGPALQQLIAKVQKPAGSEPSSA
jgi:hypothetical protein